MTMSKKKNDYIPMCHRAMPIFPLPASDAHARKHLRPRSHKAENVRLGAMLALILLAVLTAVLTTGCAMIPPEPVVTGPLSVAPVADAPVPAATGAIYQPVAHGSVPLFEDRRPRHIGDIVTIVLKENTRANKGASTSASRNAGSKLGFNVIPEVLNDALGGKLGPNQNLDISGGHDMTGQGASSAEHNFAGSITTTVLAVLPNGNLQVAGEKQIAINRGSEYVRFSGIVDPRAVQANNTVLSTQVADLRVEYRNKGAIDEVQTMGWLQRFFLNVSPF